MSDEKEKIENEDGVGLVSPQTLSSILISFLWFTDIWTSFNYAMKHTER